MSRVGKVKVKMVKQDGHSKPNHSFSECFADASSFSAYERGESQSVPVFTIWRLVPLACMVKAVRNKFLRGLPLLRVVLDTFNVDQEHFIFFKDDPTN